MEAEDEETARNELLSLQRRYRHVEQERRQTFQKINGVIWRQEEMIKALRQEVGNIQASIKTAQCKVHKNTNTRWIQRLRELLSKQNEYQLLIGNEKQRIKELTEQIRRVELKNFEFKKKIGLNANGQHVFLNHDRKLRQVQNQLYMCNVRNNQLLNKNSVIRKEVDHLLKERTRFGRVYMKMSKGLMVRKSIIADIVKQATLAYDQRDEAQLKMKMLKERSQVDQTLLASEIKDLKRKIEQNQELRAFMIAKNQERQEIHKEDLHQVWADQDKEKDPEEKIRFYESAFERLKYAAQESDIHNLVSQFLNTEEQNFVLFCYINELRDETERLESKVGFTKENLLNLESQEKMVMESHEKKMTHLEEHLKLVTKAGDVVGGKLDACQKAMDLLKSGISDLCEFTECPRESLTEVLGGSEGITEFNILDYLTLLENYVCELILLWQYVSFKPKPDKKHQLERHSIPLVDTVSQESSQVSLMGLVSPPTLGDFSWDGHDTQPLTRERLQEISTKSIQATEARKRSPSKLKVGH